jgi:hypothetical protein
MGARQLSAAVMEVLAAHQISAEVMALATAIDGDAPGISRAGVILWSVATAK